MLFFIKDYNFVIYKLVYIYIFLFLQIYKPSWLVTLVLKSFDYQFIATFHWGVRELKRGEQSEEGERSYQNDSKIKEGFHGVVPLVLKMYSGSSNFRGSTASNKEYF